MITYIVLFKLTQEGIENIRDAPARIEKGIKALESMGGKLIALYSTMGEYDYVGITEWPNDEAAARFILMWGATGVVRTTTMRAFTVEEFKEIVAKIP